MLVITLGCIGLGFVWGWLVGRWQRQILRVPRSNLTVLMTTLLLAAEIILFANWSLFLSFLFLGTAFFSLLLHRMRYRQLLLHAGDLHHPG